MYAGVPTIWPSCVIRSFEASVVAPATRSRVASPKSPIRARPVFTSSAASPAPGDWTGIQFLDVPSPASVVDHAQVMYAGDDYQSAGSACGVDGSGAHDSYAAISFAERPAMALVTNTTIAHSLHNGIDRVWNGAPLDFAPTNTFTSNAGCAQSFPVPSSNVCPQPVPCD